MNPVRSLSRRIFLVVIALSIAIEGMAIVSYSVGAQSQPTPSDDQVNAVARQLYCPVCENITLDVCSTQACVQWRELIREKLAQGQTPDQITSYFVQQYCDRVVAVPPHTGINWILYILPPLIFLLALIFTIRFIKEHSTSRAEISALPKENDSAELPRKGSDDE